MPITLNDIFPNANSGLNSIGFFFGAGTSKIAGFPLTTELTQKVVSSFNSDQRKTLDNILKKEKLIYDKTKGEPDIERISDIIQRYKLSSDINGLDDIAITIRKKIYEEIKSIDNPNLDYHTEFFTSLKTLLSETNETIWIFTTNYDLVFEKAAAKAGIPIYNGFEGIIDRYFDPERLSLKYGHVKSKTFEPFKEPNIKILKLHGSISWFKNNDKIIETSDDKNINSDNCVMILPNLQKGEKTLESPYDSIFRIACQIIGRECKYILSCGYSYRDQHINEQIFIPFLREKKIRLIAFCSSLTNEIDELKQYSCFNYITKDKIKINTSEITEINEYYKFEELIKLFKNI